MCIYAHPLWNWIVTFYACSFRHIRAKKTKRWSLKFNKTYEWSSLDVTSGYLLSSSFTMKLYSNCSCKSILKLTLLFILLHCLPLSKYLYTSIPNYSQKKVSCLTLKFFIWKREIEILDWLKKNTFTKCYKLSPSATGCFIAPNPRLCWAQCLKQ